jgi:hypothetical protein
MHISFVQLRPFIQIHAPHISLNVIVSRQRTMFQDYFTIGEKKNNNIFKKKLV